MDLNSLKEEMAKDLYGISLNDALQQGICIQCKRIALPRCYSRAGKVEYRISGLCEVCFDEISKEEGE